MEAFLEETCLVNDTDAWETDADRVTLMTLHASKGLEFPVVYLTAVEEGLLPHERSREHPEQLEEERRLMFVGITRAQQELQISLARYRDFRGQRKLTIPSSFLMELPRAEMDVESVGLESRPVAETRDSQLAPDEPWHESPSGYDAVFDEGAVAGQVVSLHDDADAAVYAHDNGRQDVQPRRSPRPIHLTTAAALANGGRPMPPTAPDLFRQGMWVLHPTHGLGQIIALSGIAASRKATIDFPPPSGRKRLLLSEGSLQPVRGDKDAAGKPGRRHD